jgi:hypothetical protein
MRRVKSGAIQGKGLKVLYTDTTFKSKTFLKVNFRMNIKFMQNKYLLPCLTAITLSQLYVTSRLENNFKHTWWFYKKHLLLHCNL